ncbi:hypothetical protein LFL96_01010 [Paraburkholderia sp. D15]|uniref:hypothetical protein n=1 Tax=Paraburkholderia sp. D15 TaxID=2880218 RepID=UPI002479D687|nr:hypothetical protein [Paraburkholderia sp. D15]WGS50121.1 hypothetical protein LFL96_01010 [Paraburkholderia sp. D15]
MRNGNAQEPRPAHETDAALCFSQDVSGRVAILLFPYKSDLSKAKEDNILLQFGLLPNDLTEKVIRKTFKTFFQYCVATSTVSTGSYSAYAFRQWLSFRDMRNKKAQRDVAFRMVEKMLVLALTAVGAWATLFVAGKWPLH